jgi:broad specificity phosphatase PhoE
MSGPLPVVYRARHDETAWSLTGQHTGLTDLPLTERGERNARRLGDRLSELTLAKIFTSPRELCPSCARGRADRPTAGTMRARPA